METQPELKPLMFVGTSSDVGKSIITAGFCRLLKQDGYHPAPFKGQNMSLNSYATPEGLEIGRAQAVQAEAAGIPCHTDMNPVLLKPTDDQRSQVILNGKPAGTQTAREYFLSEDRAALFGVVLQAYHRLAARYQPIVLEGAGSITELNLKARDITNMKLAIAAGAVTYLVTDIDRGGVFASLYGTMALLDPEERACIRGIIINKFRGDPALFKAGRQLIEKLCGVPVIGVLPYFSDIEIEEEDGVALSRHTAGPVPDKINVAVVRVGRMSNFTDFSCLSRDERVQLYYTDTAAGLAAASVIILPGTKNTLADLAGLREKGLDKIILSAFRQGKTVIGICGGYQMMGESLADPLQLESSAGEMPGLGLLPVHTLLQPEKITRQCRFTFEGTDSSGMAYEIHMGRTAAPGGAQPAAVLSDGAPDGYYRSEKCWGSYLHGILDHQPVIDALLSPYTRVKTKKENYTEFRNRQYDKLAALLRDNLDINQVYAHLKK